jgi:hypothetical protein
MPFRSKHTGTVAAEKVRAASAMKYPEAVEIGERIEERHRAVIESVIVRDGRRVEPGVRDEREGLRRAPEVRRLVLRFAAEPQGHFVIVDGEVGLPDDGFDSRAERIEARRDEFFETPVETDVADEDYRRCVRDGTVRRVIRSRLIVGILAGD